MTAKNGFDAEIVVADGFPIAFGRGGAGGAIVILPGRFRLRAGQAWSRAAAVDVMAQLGEEQNSRANAGARPRSIDHAGMMLVAAPASQAALQLSNNPLLRRTAGYECTN